MNEKKEASGQSKKSLLSRLGNLCERKKALCSGVFGGLGGLIAGHTFYIVGERMSREMGEQFAKVYFMGLLLISAGLLLSYYKSSHITRAVKKRKFVTYTFLSFWLALFSFISMLF